MHTGEIFSKPHSNGNNQKKNRIDVNTQQKTPSIQNSNRMANIQYRFLYIHTHTYHKYICIIYVHIMIFYTSTCACVSIVYKWNTTGDKIRKCICYWNLGNSNSWGKHEKINFVVNGMWLKIMMHYILAVKLPRPMKRKDTV